RPWAPGGRRGGGAGGGGGGQGGAGGGGGGPGGPAGAAADEGRGARGGREGGVRPAFPCAAGGEGPPPGCGHHGNAQDRPDQQVEELAAAANDHLEQAGDDQDQPGQGGQGPSSRA